jgi:DNA repair exonuclease SbcCD ATPase subunit
VSQFEHHGAALKEPTTRRSGARLAELGSRLARSFIRPQDGLDLQEQPTAQHDPQDWHDHMPRFAVVRHGYHCSSVDQYVTELEQELGELDQELAQLRAQRPAGDGMVDEIKRVGEQTSAVLIAAHEQADEIVKQARAEAERCVAEASSQAAAIVGEATEKLRELEQETLTVHGQRERLLGDVRSAATTLSELVDVSFARFPPQVTPPEPPPAVTELDDEQSAEPAGEPTSDSSAVPA